ncbi:serine hydrolase domain-containing protein [Paenibacillus eucommiae]|uniref:CubicO group peptidase (Beta-lactamase class C family) n=1 Tax=Paenibacillus eucommiae TaxID=1355755 RepID=A0ABS4IWS9_9BACL|nr:serine hydrolase domain-containing protein [Paenibacillus eucommiae]MBP1991456.1 CubicO group peptidase (beta-lactamase class C family) [Paenibacillus eucommiae]
MRIDHTELKRNTERCNAELELIIQEGKTSCLSVAVLKRDRIVYEFYHGDSSPIPGFAAPISKGTMFNVGSVTKPITGAALVKLIEMGRLKLNDSISRHIPEFRFPEVTILHLLTHTAGFNTSDADHIEAPVSDEDVPHYLQRIYEISHLLHKPGEVCNYCSWGYCILMDVVQRVSGMPFEEFVRATLFEPLGMQDSVFSADLLEGREYVLPWHQESGRFLEREAKTATIGDRGLFTTATDLLRFASVFLNGGVNPATNAKVFSSAAIACMLREIPDRRLNKTPVFWRKGEQDTYGCFSDLHSPSAVGHTGFSGCMLMIDPEFDIAAAILTNSLTWHADWNNYSRVCSLVMAMSGARE